MKQSMTLSLVLLATAAILVAGHTYPSASAVIPGEAASSAQEAEHGRPRLVGVLRPVSVPLAAARYSALIGEELDRIKLTIPAVTLVAFMFDVEVSTKADWLKVLELCQSRDLRALIAFARYDRRTGADTGYRPFLRGGRWQWSKLGEFVASRECITHSALYAVQMVDEPWHLQKRPFYSGDRLKAMYADLKSLAPPGAEFRIHLAFSRELWKRIYRDHNPACYWDEGMADVVQISTLEFQNGAYQFELLDNNHYWSRRIIHAETPDIPLLTSVQVMGRRYGPAPGYWFPRERNGYFDLLRLLTDVTRPEYEGEHPLAGLMFQSWDSASVRGRPFQYTLGDRDLVGEGLPQALAARDAIETINGWIARECER